MIYKTIILLTILTLLMLSACTKQTQQEICINEICFEDECFKIEIPRTQEEMLQGLMHVEYLPEDEGMLFIFKEPRAHGFWMMNTLIPLDMIWLDEELQVVYVQTAIPCTSEPCTIYAPNTTALYTLEINAELAREKNIEIGQEATLNLCE
jgi:uncharacterized membrane protein (UPF0127 family)